MSDGEMKMRSLAGGGAIWDEYKEEWITITPKEEGEDHCANCMDDSSKTYTLISDFLRGASEVICAACGKSLFFTP